MINVQHFCLGRFLQISQIVEVNQGRSAAHLKAMQTAVVLVPQAGGCTMYNVPYFVVCDVTHVVIPLHPVYDTFLLNLDCDIHCCRRIITQVTSHTTKYENVILSGTWHVEQVA